MAPWRCDAHSFRYANANAKIVSETGRPQQQAVNNGDVFKALSIFVHTFNLLFLFGFINCCIQCAWRLCYCCCPLAVCLDQLRLILPGVDWTLQMSAIIYWFLSSLVAVAGVRVCSCVRTCAYVRMRACLSKTDGGGCLCLCVGNESISFTLVSPDKGGRVPCSCICCLSVSFLFLSLSVFSHMLVEFCHHHPLPLSSLWLTSPASITL